MSYYFSKTIPGNIDEAVQKVTEKLKEQGFGIITEIDIRETFRKKLDVDFRPYRILGACNPNFAYQALLMEDKIGAMLPCNVIVQQLDDQTVEVAAVDPVSSMSAVENEELGNVAGAVRSRLKQVVDAL